MNKETPREAVKNVLERMREGGLWQPKGFRFVLCQRWWPDGHTYFTRKHSDER